MAKKKTAKKEAPVTADEIPVEEYDPTRYTPWVPAKMPVGGKSNSTEQLDDHPTEHNHSADAISDIVDRFADLRLYVPAANTAGVAGDLQVDGNLVLGSTLFANDQIVVDVNQSHARYFRGRTDSLPAYPTYSFDDDPTTGLYLVSNGVLGVKGDLQVASRVTGPAHGNYTTPPYSFEGRETTGVFAGGDFVGFTNDGNYKLLCYNDKTSIFNDLELGGQARSQTGTLASPAYSFKADTKTGIYYTGEGGWASKAIVSISANGTAAANFGDKGCSIPPVYTNTKPNRPNVFIDEFGGLHRSTAAVFDIEESDYNELVEKVAALTAQIETLMERVESLERSTPITADA